MSKVPMPDSEYRYDFGQSRFVSSEEKGTDLYTSDQLRAYGDARAAEARRLALEEAARFITEEGAHEPNDVQAAAIRALAEPPKDDAPAALAPQQPAAQPVAFDLNAAVDRFLGWPLPQDFAPDGGITFDRKVRTAEGEKDRAEMRPAWWPVGTNLLTADQARAMLAHVLGLSAEQQPAAQPGAADAGKPSGPTAITAAAGPATNGVFCSVDEPQQPAVQPEPMARFCPGCGSVGPVPEKYRDCCPDGGKARMIPEPLARHCHDLFHLALSAPGDALHPQRQSAIDPVTVFRLADIAIDAAVESALHEVGYYELEGDANAHRKAASTKAAEAYAALCRALGVADLHPQPQLNRAAAEKPKPASVTPLNPAAAWPFPSRSRT